MEKKMEMSLKINQMMVDEWKENCLQKQELIFLMLTIKPNGNVGTYQTAIMDKAMLIRQLEQCIYSLKNSANGANSLAVKN